MQLQPTRSKFLRQPNQKKNRTVVQSGLVPVFFPVHRTGPLIPRYSRHIAQTDIATLWALVCTAEALNALRIMDSYKGAALQLKVCTENIVTK